MKLAELKKQLDYVIGYVYGTYYDHKEVLDEKEMRKVIDVLYKIYNAIAEPTVYIDDIKDLVLELIQTC